MACVFCVFTSVVYDHFRCLISVCLIVCLLILFDTIRFSFSCIFLPLSILLSFRPPLRCPRVAQNQVPRRRVPRNRVPRNQAKTKTPVPRRQLLWNPVNQVERVPNAKSCSNMIITLLNNAPTDAMLPTPIPIATRKFYALLVSPIFPFLSSSYLLH